MPRPVRLSKLCWRTLVGCGRFHSQLWSFNWRKKSNIYLYLFLTNRKKNSFTFSWPTGHASESSWLRSPWQRSVMETRFLELGWARLLPPASQVLLWIIDTGNKSDENKICSLGCMRLLPLASQVLFWGNKSDVLCLKQNMFSARCMRVCASLLFLCKTWFSFCFHFFHRNTFQSLLLSYSWGKVELKEN